MSTYVRCELLVDIEPVFSPTNTFTRESMSMSQECLLVFPTHYARELNSANF